MKPKQLKYFLLFLCFSTSPAISWATHIIGGEIVYTCKGNDMYDFTMKIYRDCANGIPCFDSDPDPGCPGGLLVGTVTVFIGDRVFTNVALPPPNITEIEPNISNPCLRPPPGVCVEEGVYEFSLELPPQNFSYTISYQRCCRNQTIKNIRAPGAAGATYTTEISPLAQAACNSSPEFNDFPPIIICNGVDINFDHSATDPDGDSLVYSLCQPYFGGNMANPAPTQASPPPYDGVNYVGNYSITNPILANRPGMQINAQTGLLTGIPTLLGQFVVGICVQAYRDGELMNEVRRDFQFNVGDCVPIVNADIEETELIMRNGQEIFYVKICNKEGDLINESTQRSDIRFQDWVIGLPDGPATSIAWNFNDIPFPGPGIYDGQLILNDGLPCNDTALIQIEVFPELKPDFSYDYNICEIEPVAFTNLSTSAISPTAITDWIWDLGNGDTIYEQDFSYLYDTSGAFPVALTVKDINDCEETITQTVSYFPVPNEVVYQPSEASGCEPLSVQFNNLSAFISSEYTIDWDFGDGNTGRGITPTNLYELPGIYDISAVITSPDGCTIDTTWQELVEVLQVPIADFSFSPEVVSNFAPTVMFTDRSLLADVLLWDFNNIGTSTELNPSFDFVESGLNPILLTVTNINGCTDTITKYVDLLPEIRYTLPNAFTPNGDGNNDFYFGKGNTEEAIDFYFTIWNRYGEMIYETTDPSAGWNGRKNNEDQLAPNGVYIAKVKYKNFKGEEFTKTSYVTLVK